jgi:multiple sugar transport system permease protein
MSRFGEKNTGIINYMDLRHPGVKFLYWVLFAFMLIVAFMCFAPPIWVLLSSMKDIKEFFMVPPTIIPKTFHPEKLIETWNKMNFFRYYINTFEVAAGTITVSIICNGLAGYVLSRLKPRGSSVIFMLMLWSMMLPNSVSMVPLFKNIVSFPIIGVNLTNTFIPMWLMAGANAFYVIVFKSFFDGIPKSLIEAARLDGCSDLGIFSRIVLPLSKPVMMVIVIFSLNATWGDFFWPYLVLKDTKMYTVMVKIFTMKGNGGYSMDLQMVALTFAIIPPAILFIFFQKYIMQGFTLSGIKE